MDLAPLTAGFFDTDRFMPHGHCFLWNADILWTVVGSDAVIAASYYAIPAALLLGLRRRETRNLRPIILLFCAFIFACGTTHLIEIYTIWVPRYDLDALAKLVTAAVSLATAVSLWPLVARGTQYLETQEAMQARLAQANSRLRSTVSEFERQNHNMSVLTRMGDQLQRATDLDELARIVASAVPRLLPRTHGALYLPEGDPADEVFLRRASWGSMSGSPQMRTAECTALRTGLRCPDPTDPDRTCVRADCDAAGDRHCLPINSDARMLGLLRIEGVPADVAARNHDALHLLTERVSLAIQSLQLQMELRYHSTRDALTGLYNRRYLDETLRVETRRAVRSAAQYAVIILDVDYLKTINDTHGHEAGDRALRHLAGVLRQSIRGGDVPCRYGGEEFVVVLPGMAAAEAERTAERIRANLAESVRGLEQPGLTGLTVSAGVASFGDHGDEAAAVLRAADKALYEAKAAGRNTVRRA